MRPNAQKEVPTVILKYGPWIVLEALEAKTNPSR